MLDLVPGPCPADHAPLFPVAGAGGAGFSVCVVTPAGVVTSAEVASWLPGHQARNHPSPVLAWTSVPSLRTRVTPVTSEAMWPSTRVSGPSLAEVRWATDVASMLPAPAVPTRVEVLLLIVLLVIDPLASFPVLATLMEPPPAPWLETMVTAGPVRHVASALSPW